MVAEGATIGARALGGRDVRLGQLAAHDGRPAGGATAMVPSPVRSAKVPSGHSSRLLARGPAGEADAAHLVEVAERREVDVLVVDVEPRGRAAVRLPERRHQVREARAPPWKSALARVTSKRSAHPLERALEILEAVVVDAGFAAEEVALELAAALEQMKRAGEVALAVQRELFARDKFTLLGEGDFTGTFHMFKGGRELKGNFYSARPASTIIAFPNLEGCARLGAGSDRSHARLARTFPEARRIQVPDGAARQEG